MIDKTYDKITYNGIHYVIVEEIDNYVYTVNVNDETDGIIFKKKKENHLEIFERVVKDELVDAYAKYFMKHDGLIRIIINDD